MSQKDTVLEDRRTDISISQALSCVAVVMLHTNGVFWKFDYERYWITANIIESLMYFAVPVFFMITGSTLLDYRERYSTKKFLEKRAKKTFIPFLLWSFIGFWVMVIMHRIDIKELTFKDIVEMFVNCKILPIYWFFIPLFAVYLCIPILSAISINRKEIYMYLVCIVFCLNIFLPFIFSLIGISYNNSLRIMGEYLIYTVVGYLISHYETKSQNRIIIYILGIAGLVSHIAGTYFLSMRAGEISGLFKGYLNVPCFFYSIAVFLFIKKVSPYITNSFCLKIIKIICKYSMCIYLCQCYIIAVLERIFNIYSIIYRVFGAFLVVIICIFIAFIGRKIPFIKYFFPE